MPQKTLTIVQNKATGYTYYTTRQKKGDKADNKLKLRKYDPILKAHAWFEEVKGSKPKKKKADNTKAEHQAKSKKDLKAKK